jgi:hypothetical protein
MNTDDVKSAAVNHLIKYCMKENNGSVIETTCHTVSFFSGKCVNDIKLKQSDIDTIKSKLKSFYIKQNHTQKENNTLTEFSTVLENNPQAEKFKEGFTHTNTKLRMLCYCLLYEYSKMKYPEDDKLSNIPSVMPYINKQFDESGKLIAGYKIDNSSDKKELLVTHITILYNHVNPQNDVKTQNGGKSHKSRRTRKHSKKNHRKSLRRRRYIR